MKSLAEEKVALSAEVGWEDVDVELELWRRVAELPFLVQICTRKRV